MSKNLDELVGELTAFHHDEAAQVILKLRWFLDDIAESADDGDGDSVFDTVDEYKAWLKNGI